MRDYVSRHLIPADKKLAAGWLASLTERGQAEVFSGEQLDTSAVSQILPAAAILPVSQ